MLKAELPNNISKQTEIHSAYNYLFVPYLPSDLHLIGLVFIEVLAYA